MGVTTSIWNVIDNAQDDPLRWTFELSRFPEGQVVTKTAEPLWDIHQCKHPQAAY